MHTSFKNFIGLPKLGTHSAVVKGKDDLKPVK